jgi:bile acid:Na+ symporter, BASS family
MERVLRWIRGRVLVLLLGAYALGAFAPAAGEALRGVRIVGHVPALGPAGFSLPMVMLGILLFIAGLSTKMDEVAKTFRRPRLLVVGLTLNCAYPITFLALSAALLHVVDWRSMHQEQSLLVGLAMIGAMPVAGSSAAWSQNADGNLALSLGLLWGSTFLSPIISPLVFLAAGHITTGDYSEALHAIGRQGSIAFLLLAVVLPSLLGLAARRLLGGWRVNLALPALKVLSLVDLMLLNYVNASASLPRVVARPEPAFIALVLVLGAVMCAGAFATGWWVPRRFGARREDQTAMMFGLGMSNNGSSLVLAQATLPDRPLVLVAIILYNLVQQVGAGVVDARRRVRSRRPEDLARAGAS